MPPVGFETKISAGERPQAAVHLGYMLRALMTKKKKVADIFANINQILISRSMFMEVPSIRLL